MRTTLLIIVLVTMVGALAGWAARPDTSPIIAVSYTAEGVTVYRADPAKDQIVRTIPGCKFLIKADDDVIRVGSFEESPEKDRLCLRQYQRAPLGTVGD